MNETERHRLLASKQRRETLELLENRAMPLELQELAAGIADRQHGLTPRERRPVELIAAALHHNHLPMMDDFGVIDYRPSAKRIEKVRIPADLQSH